MLFHLFRYVNDSPTKYANSVMKRIEMDGDVLLMLFALKDIKKGTEIRYFFAFVVITNKCRKVPFSGEF